MKVLQCVLMLAVVFGASMAAAQQSEKAKEDRLPWWKLSDEGAEKDRPRAREGEDSSVGNKKSAIGKLLAAEPERRLVPQRDPVVEGARRPRRPDDKVSKPEPRERLVYRVANVSAMEVARTVDQFLAMEAEASGTGATQTVILSDAVTNSLIISGTSDAIHETVELVEQLDREPLMVYVETVIGLVKSREGLSLLAPNPEGPELSCSHEEACELIEEFSESDAVEILARPQVMTLDNQPAFIQVGERVPRVTSAKGGQAASIELENVGIIFGLTPRISDDRVVTMEIDLEKSELGPVEDGVPVGIDAKGTVIRSPRMETMMIQTTVKISPRRAVIVGGMTLQDGDDRGELVLVVMPHVVESKG